MEPSDRLLLERSKRGDPKAFEALVRPHLDSVRRYAYSHARSWDEADDLAQEALIKAYRSIGSFEGRSALSTWLYAVTRNVCLDYVRSRSGRDRLLMDPLSDDLQAEHDTALELLDGKRSAERLWRAIKRLEPEFRVPLVLFDIEGLSYEQIAHVEQVPIGTVRSRLSRARQRLQAMMTAGGEPTPSSRPGTESAPTPSKGARLLP